jgi:hypothetical protein
MSEAQQPIADFLARSVHKALDGDATIEPRLPSLFEPSARAWQETPAVERDLSIELTQTAAGRDFAEEDSTAGRPNGDVHPHQRLEHESVAAVARRPDSRPSTIDAGAPTAIAARDTAPAQAAMIPAGDIAVLGHDLAPPPEKPARRLGEPDQFDKPPLVRLPAVNLEWPPPQTAPTRHDDVISENDARRARPGSVEDGGRGAVIPIPVEIKRPFDIRPPSAAPASRRDGARGEPPAAAAASVVNVTIGRVEVRAVSPAAARPRNDRPGAGPMSLDDYLKQRRGGR